MAQVEGKRDQVELQVRNSPIRVVFTLQFKNTRWWSGIYPFHGLGIYLRIIDYETPELLRDRYAQDVVKLYKEIVEEHTDKTRWCCGCCPFTQLVTFHANVL